MKKSLEFRWGIRCNLVWHSHVKIALCSLPSGAHTPTGKKSLKLPCEWIFIEKWVQTLINHLFWWKWWSGKESLVLSYLIALNLVFFFSKSTFLIIRRTDFKTLTSRSCKNNFLSFIWFPGLWVVGWRRSQHPKAPWPVAALPELRDAALFTQGHGWRVSSGGFEGSSRKLQQPRRFKEARPLTTGVCMMIEL